MTPEDCQRLEACLLEVAEILYRNTVKEELTTFESLEKAVRTKMLEEVSPTDWVNSQRLLHPLICLGDGHDGVWNLFQEIGSTSGRQEILDWYHLKENLYKVGGSLKRLKAAETFLWQGQVQSTIALFVDLTLKSAQNFIHYLKKHLKRIVNYQYLSIEGLCSIG